MAAFAPDTSIPTWNTTPQRPGWSNESAKPGWVFNPFATTVSFQIMPEEPPEQNPYQTPTTAAGGGRHPSADQQHQSPSLWRSALTGAGWSVFSTLPIVAITALFFRFPIPFAGYKSGVEALVPAMIAVLFYGVAMGGLVLLGGLGAIGGLVAAIAFRYDRKSCRITTIILSLLVTSAGVLTLAVLDKLIGPW